jgi:hypothetical protein
MAKPFVILAADVRNKYDRLSDEEVKNENTHIEIYVSFCCTLPAFLLYQTKNK